MAASITKHTDKSNAHEVEQQPRVVKTIDFSVESNKIRAASTEASVLIAQAGCITHGIGVVVHTPEGAAISVALNKEGGSAIASGVSVNAVAGTHKYFSIANGGEYHSADTTYNIVTTGSIAAAKLTVYAKYTRLFKSGSENI